jgi:hypothetical protein
MSLLPWQFSVLFLADWFCVEPRINFDLPPDATECLHLFLAGHCPAIAFGESLCRPELEQVELLGGQVGQSRHHAQRIDRCRGGLSGNRCIRRPGCERDNSCDRDGKQGAHGWSPFRRSGTDPGFGREPLLSMIVILGALVRVGCVARHKKAYLVNFPGSCQPGKTGVVGATRQFKMPTVAWRPQGWNSTAAILLIRRVCVLEVVAPRGTAGTAFKNRFYRFLK